MRSIDGVQVPVIEMADLVMLKILASHPKDLDSVRVRTVLKMLEDALGQSDLLSALEQCRSRSQAAG